MTESPDRSPRGVSAREARVTAYISAFLSVKVVDSTLVHFILASWMSMSVHCAGIWACFMKGV